MILVRGPEATTFDDNLTKSQIAKTSELETLNYEI